MATSDMKAKLVVEAQTTGTREVGALADEIEELARDSGEAAPRLKELAQRLRSVGDAAQDGGKRTRDAAGDMSGSMDAAGQAARRMAGHLAAAFTVGEALRAAQDMEKLRVGLEAVTGSSARARAEMEFVSQLAARIGADVVATGNAWLGYQAAIKGTAVEGEVGRQVFEAVATSMAKAGKSSAETSNALLALQQIASKGTVAMEELRGQLGEALPGALQAAAKGLGLTTEQLIAMVESGQLAAQDLFPALTKGLQELYGTAAQGQTLAQEITNIKNAFVEMSAYIGEAGGNEALKAWAERAQAAVTALGIGLVDFGKKVGAVIAALVSRDFAQLEQVFADIEAEGRDKLVKAALHNEQLRAAIEAVGSEADKAALAVAAQGNATREAGAQAQAAAPSFAAMAAAYVEVRKEVQAQIELAGKEVAAAKARGQAAVAEAKLKGDEVVLRQAIGKAAADEARALADLAQKRQTEVDVLRAELDNKRALLKANNDNSQSRQKELADLEQLIAKKQVEADATRGQAAAAQAEARARGEAAQAAQAALSAAQAASTARVAEAKASLSLLETQRSLASQSEQLARMMGNEEAARGFRIQQLRLEVQIINAKAVVQRAEAEGSIAVARAALEELRVKGEITKVKEAELNATIKLSEARLAEAEATKQSARLTEQAISNLINYGDEAGAAAAKSDKVGKAIAESMDKAKEATEDLGGAVKDAAAAMDGMANAAWKAGEDLVSQARRHNASLGELQGTWLDATAAASRYAQEMAQLVYSSNKNIAAMREEHAQLVEQMEALDRQQNQLRNQGGDAARSIEDLRLRLLELNGTEEEVARARHERDKAEVRRRQAMLSLELQRAQLRQQDDEAARLAQEIALLDQQLALMGKVFAEEERQRKARQRNGSAGGGSSTTGGGSGSSVGGGMPKPTASNLNVTMHVNGVNDPVRLARMIEPELKKLARLAR